MSLLPKGLTGRTVLVLLAAVSFVHFGSMLIYERGLIHGVLPWHDRSEAGTRERLEAARQVIERQPPAERSAVAALLSSGSLVVTWSPDTTQAVPSVLPIADLREPDGILPLGDGTVLQYRLLSDPHTGHETHATLLSTTVMVLGVIAVAALLVRSIAAPLRRLAGAADAIGHKAETRPVAEEGPNEVRQVARAFNAMQQRIARLIDDRTQALAAVSHDLRTPITRLRLQAGFIADPDIQVSIDRDLDEMDAMIDTTLAYLRGDADTETQRPTDLPALLETLLDAEEDQGYPVSYDGPSHLTLVVRPLAIKRAFGNLIANATAYGGKADVRLRLEPEGAVVTIDDEGPGIPVGDIERVFDPFVRLEPSRNHSTGGVGLGLAIARQTIAAEGGTLVLINRPAGGLTARVMLPARALATTPSATRQALHLSPRGDGKATPAHGEDDAWPDLVIGDLRSSRGDGRNAG